MKSRERNRSVFGTLAKVFAIALTMGLGIFAQPQNIFAEDHTCSDPNNCSAFTIEVYRCTTDGGCVVNALDDFAESIAAGTANSYLVGSNDKVAAGDNLVVAVKFVPGTLQDTYPKTIVDTVTYNTDYFETVKKEGGEFYSYIPTTQLPYTIQMVNIPNVGKIPVPTSEYTNTMKNVNAGSVTQQIQPSNQRRRTIAGYLSEK